MCVAMTPRQFSTSLHAPLVFGATPGAPSATAHTSAASSALAACSPRARRGRKSRPSTAGTVGPLSISTPIRLSASDYEALARRGDLFDLDSVYVASLPVIDDDDSVAAGAATAHELGAQGDTATAKAAAGASTIAA